jgi:hypothetical protein
MCFFRGGMPAGYSRTSGADYSREYVSSKTDSDGKVVPIANGDVTKEYVLNVPETGEGAHCAKIGEIVPFVASEDLEDGDSVTNASGAAPVCWNMAKITLSTDGTGTQTQRMGTVQGDVSSGKVGLMVYTRDQVIAD